MRPDILAWFALALVAAFAVALAAPGVSRRLPASRVRQVAGTAAVSPVSATAAGETAVPAVQAVIEREPYDNGCLIVETSAERDA